MANKGEVAGLAGPLGGDDDLAAAALAMALSGASREIGDPRAQFMPRRDA